MFYFLDHRIRQIYSIEYLLLNINFINWYFPVLIMKEQPIEKKNNINKILGWATRHYSQGNNLSHSINFFLIYQNRFLCRSNKNQRSLTTHTQNVICSQHSVRIITMANGMPAIFHQYIHFSNEKTNQWTISKAHCTTAHHCTWFPYSMENHR